MNTIMLVEDNKDMNFLLTNILTEEGYNVISVGNGARALEEVKKKIPDLVLLDMRLPGMNGIEILERFSALDADFLVIMITAFAQVSDAVKAMKLGAYDYITKPFNNDELLITIRNALKTRSLSREVEDLRSKLKEKEIIKKKFGQSDAIKKVIKQVELISPTNMSVILQGKSGTGKEVIANLIHAKSLRKHKPFVALDCGAIPETLIESELFGYDKGAFTGADTIKIGKFEEANGGTLLLDEITNLPYDGQAKLLRAIEEKKIEHIGGKRAINVNVRIIATTNLDFSTEIKKGRFREDLYHRLNEFFIELPPVSERIEDIPVLAHQFLQDANQELGKSVQDFSAEAKHKLTAYSWPGNIRELKNVVKRATLMAEGEFIKPDDLNINVDAKKNDGLMNNLENSSFSEIKDQFEKEVLVNALHKAEGNKTKAAQILKMNRKTFYRKLKSFDLLDSDDY